MIVQLLMQQVMVDNSIINTTVSLTVSTGEDVENSDIIVPLHVHTSK